MTKLSLRTFLVGALVTTWLAAQAPKPRERATDFLQAARKLGVDAQVVRQVDRLWPDDRLCTASVDDFRRAYVAGSAEGFDLDAAIRTFRLYQDFVNGLTPLRQNARLEQTAPVPEFGPRQYTPPATFGIDANVAESEPNGTLATADPINLGDVVTGCNSSGDDDFFVFTVGAATNLSVRVDPLVSGGSCGSFHTNPRLELLDSGGTRVAFNDDTNGSYPVISQLVPSGTYYLVVDPSGTATGDYTMTTAGSPAVTLSCGGTTTTGGMLNAGESYSFLLGVTANGVFAIDVLTATIGSSLGAELTLVDTDLSTVIETSTVGSQPGDARIVAGLLAGQYLCIVQGTGTTTGNFGVTLACQGPLPTIACGAPALNVNVSEGEVPLIGLNIPQLSKYDVTVTDTGLPDETFINILDAHGNVVLSDTSFASPTGTSTATATTVGANAFARLIADPAGTVSTGWRDTPVAKSWCRPQAAYPGPTSISVTSPTFTFVNDHLSPAGILTIRKRRDFHIDGGAFDSSTYIDEAYVDVTTASGTMRFHPTAIRLPAPPNASGFTSIGTAGMPSDVAASDGVYYGIHLLDAGSTTNDSYTIEFDFDVSSLGITGSQITGLGFVAQWYFAGDALSTTDVLPPTTDDSSEETDIFVDDMELKRQSAATWDRLGDALMGTNMPPVANPQVSISLACTPITLNGVLSAEDDSNGDIQAATPLQAFAFATGTGGTSCSRPGTRWTVNNGETRPTPCAGERRIPARMPVRSPNPTSAGCRPVSSGRTATSACASGRTRASTPVRGTTTGSGTSPSSASTSAAAGSRSTRWPQRPAATSPASRHRRPACPGSPRTPTPTTPSTAVSAWTTTTPPSPGRRPPTGSRSTTTCRASSARVRAARSPSRTSCGSST